MNDIDALIAEARYDAKVFHGLRVGELLDSLADELEKARRDFQGVWNEGYIAAEWNSTYRENFFDLHGHTLEEFVAACPACLLYDEVTNEGE